VDPDERLSAAQLKSHPFLPRDLPRAGAPARDIARKQPAMSRIFPRFAVAAVMAALPAPTPAHALSCPAPPAGNLFIGAADYAKALRALDEQMSLLDLGETPMERDEVEVTVPLGAQALACVEAAAGRGCVAVCPAEAGVIAFLFRAQTRDGHTGWHFITAELRPALPDARLSDLPAR